MNVCWTVWPIATGVLSLKSHSKLAIVPRGFAATNVTLSGAVPVVESPVIGVAEIDVVCAFVDSAEVDPPPPQAASIAAASSDRHTLRAIRAASAEVMFIVVA